MADIEKGLPVRTEDDADQKVQVKIVDRTTTSQQAEVDSDNNLHVECKGDNPAGGEETLRLSELGAPNGDGDYDATNNTKPDSTGIVGHDENATPDETHQNKRVTASRTGTKTGLHVAILDEDSVPFSETNPLPVTFEESEGNEINDYDTASAVAAAANSNHDYSIANGNVFKLKRVQASASGRGRYELQIGDGAVSEVFVTKAVAFGTESNPNIEFDFSGHPISATGTVNTTTIRVIRNNRDDDDAQDMYSTISGVEF